MKKNLIWAVALLATVAFAAGCGGDETDPRDPGTGGSPGVGGSGGSDTGTGGTGGGMGGGGGSEDEGCTYDTECPNIQICDIDTRSCVTCTADHRGCQGETPLCDTAVEGGQCVTCLEDANCSGSLVCDTTSGTCVTCTADDHCPTGVCDTEANACVECTGSDDCSEGVCDTEQNACVTCTAAEGCGGDQVCDTSVDGGVCVECVADGDCDGDQICNTATHTCGERPSVEIDDLRRADLPIVGGNYPITGVFVTYIRPAVGEDPAGFFVQGEQDGPALFVTLGDESVDVEVGDELSFTVTDAAIEQGRLHVTAISGFSKASTGNDVSGLLQDISDANDIRSNLGDYESEYVTFAGTIRADFSGLGTDHVGAVYATDGFSIGSLPRLRMPETLNDTLDLAKDCEFVVEKGVMWRIAGEPQPMVFDPSDVTVASCPAPYVTRAMATDPNTVVVSFSRNVDPATVATDGSDFTIVETDEPTNTLEVTAAEVTALDQVTLTTASQFGVAYTVTVANVTDTYGSALTLDEALFAGTAAPPAELLITEYNPNIGTAEGGDLLELFVVQGGSVNGFRIDAHGDVNSDHIATLPDVEVATGDFILVHFDPQTGFQAETLARDEHPSASNPLNTDTAWDFGGTGVDVSYDHRVVEVRNAAGDLIDGVPFAYRSTTGTPPASFPGFVQDLQARGDWSPTDCGGSPCDYSTTPPVEDISVDISGLSTDRSLSVQRIFDAGAPADDKELRDWVTTVGTSTWGAETAAP